MGLDIAFHRTITLDPGYQPDPDVGGAWPDVDAGNVLRLWCFPEFPRALDGVPNVREADGVLIAEGFYRSSGSIRWSRAGYDAHDRFRDAVAAATGGHRSGFWYADHPAAPFADLLWFTDDQGVIATAACRRIAAAFVEHADVVRLLPEAWMVQYWFDLAAGFTAAADAGCADFR